MVSLDGVAPSRMVSVSACVNLPLHHKVQKFSSGTGSPGWSRKKGHKTVVMVVVILREKIWWDLKSISLPVKKDEETENPNIKSQCKLKLVMMHRLIIRSCPQLFTTVLSPETAGLHRLLPELKYFTANFTLYTCDNAIQNYITTSYFKETSTSHGTAHSILLNSFFSAITPHGAGSVPWSDSLSFTRPKLSKH